MTMVAEEALICEKPFGGEVPARVEDLCLAERAVALYASDMPDGFRYARGDGGQLLAWVMQGASRLGPGAMIRQARFERAYSLLFLRNLELPALTAARRRIFPKFRRATRAAELAALTLSSTTPSAAANERGAIHWIEPADCPCAGSGEIGLDLDREDSAAYSVPCPVHEVPFPIRFLVREPSADDAIG